MANNTDPAPSPERPTVVYQPIMMAPVATMPVAAVAAEPAPRPVVRTEPAPARQLTFGHFLAGLALCAAIAFPMLSGAGASRDPLVDVAVAPDYRVARIHTTYRGEPVYYVDGRWYTQRGAGWSYFRDEPVELERYRLDNDAPRPVRRAERRTRSDYAVGTGNQTDYERRRIDTPF